MILLRSTSETTNYYAVLVEHLYRSGRTGMSRKPSKRPDVWTSRLRIQAAKARVNAQDLTTLEAVLSTLDEATARAVYDALTLGYRIGGHHADELWRLVLTEHGLTTNEIEEVWTTKDARNLEIPRGLDSIKVCGD
jgi:hypothetical protein